MPADATEASFPRRSSILAASLTPRPGPYMLPFLYAYFELRMSIGAAAGDYRSRCAH